MLHVAQISFYLDPHRRRPEQLLEAWPSLVDVAEAATRRVRVSVIQACSYRATITRGGITYYFLAPEAGQRTIATSKEFSDLLTSLSVHVLHVHGLGFPADVIELARLARAIPIVIQDHANRVPRFWRRPQLRRALAKATGIAFCAAEQAQPFMDAGVLSHSAQIFAIPESTSRFSPGDRDEARRSTGIFGDPALLWVGHLDANKDPLTVLRALADCTKRLPNLQLWCCFASASLLSKVRRAIDSDSRLRGRVHLLGRVPHAQVEQLMRATDFFVLGSHREGSGYSVIEALACGLPPLVTDIPSFRALTGGKVGRLWRCDDAETLSAALLSLVAQSSIELRGDARAQFERELSFTAIGDKLFAAYAESRATVARSGIDRNGCEATQAS